MGQSYSAILDAFDLLGFGGMVADRDGHVLKFSRRAALLWREAFGPAEGLDGRHTTALKALVAEVAASPEAADWPPVALARPRARGLILHAALVVGTGPALVAVVVVIDPDEIREPSAALLRSAFGLTRSEVDLARHLCLGRALKDIARTRQTSVATLRVQLRTLFAKTRTRRQAELVALLARLPPQRDAVPSA